MFSAFLDHPKNLKFEGQDSDEEIILLLRAHFITNLSWIIPAVLIFLLPTILPQLVTLVGFNLFSLPDTYLTALLVVNYLFVLIIVFEGFLHWYFNAHLLTNKRIVDVDFHSFLYKNVDLTALSNVQEANSHVKGIFGVIFHFGDVFIQTAGARIAIDFYNVPEPHKVADIIMDQVHGSS